MSDDIALLSAAELIAGYRDGSLSPVAATEAALARIEAHNGKYNAFRLVDAEGALAAARESEERWHIKAPRGRVDGVPTSIKDILLTKGWSTPRGSKTVDLDQPWEEDAPCVARLREHGAVLLGKTTTPEFGWKGLTDSPLTGITRNPWNPERTPGGSSGGAKSAPQLRELEEGLIDPWVRTISLENSEGAVAQMHYYASHPQSFYGDGRASYDVPGIIRERLERTTEAFQLYLTGCGGDVAFGKYNDGSRLARDQLTARLQAGIEQSIAGLKRQPVEPMTWAVEPIKFPLRTDKAFSEAANRQLLANPNAKTSQRRKAAIALAWIERVKSGKPVELSCLSIGRVQMLHLPGEPFVQFQLAAQKMRPNRFVCVAGYGDCGTQVQTQLVRDHAFDLGTLHEPSSDSRPVNTSLATEMLRRT